MPNLLRDSLERVTARLFLLFVLVSTSDSLVLGQIEVHLRAEARGFARLPVELKSCQLRDQATEELGQRLVDILDNDLWLSSLIAAYQAKEGLSNHDTLGRVADLNRPFQPIRLAVQTSVSVRQKQISFEAELLDSSTLRTIERKSYRGCEETVRLLVHRAADDVVKSLTGEKGIAKSRIAFSAGTVDGKEIFVMDYDAANQRQVTNDQSLSLTPAWSADGRGLIFTSYQRNNPDLFVADLITGKFAGLLGGNGLYASPAWSPDGKRIAFVSTKDGNAEIYVMESNGLPAPSNARQAGKNVRRLTHHPAIDSSPSWSPTGREIAFTSDRLGSPQIFIMDAEGSNLQRLPLEGNYNDSPAWSPRADKIAFVSRGPAGFDIFTFDLTDETATQLTADAGSNEDPCWSPDGYRLAFSSTRDGRSDIYMMMWDGTDVRRLTYKGTCTSPAWSLNVRPEEEFQCND